MMVQEFKDFRDAKRYADVCDQTGADLGDASPGKKGSGELHNPKRLR